MATGSWRQVAIALIAVSLVVHTAMSTPPGQDKYDPNTGFQHMLKAMNRDVSPCIDFYEYACGGWRRNNPVPEGTRGIGVSALMRFNIYRKANEFLHAGIQACDSESIVKAKILYRSCMRAASMDARGSEPLIRLVNREFGGWPLLRTLAWQSEPAYNLRPSSSSRKRSREDSAEMGHEWAELMGKLRNYNSEIIVGQSVDVDPENPSRHTIVLYPAKVSLPMAEHYNPNSRQFKIYRDFLKDTTESLEPDNDLLLSDINDILKFESGLADILRQGNTPPTRMSVAKLQEYTPKIIWHIYLENALPGVEIDGDEQIIVHGLEYFKSLSKLIERTKSNRILANYLLWRFVMDRMPDLGKPFSTLWHMYSTEILGPKHQQLHRQRVCTDLVQENMRAVVSSLFIQRYFDYESKREAQTMVTNIRQAFLNMLHNVDWMDDDTKGAAIQKVNSMKEHIGYSEPLPDSAQLDQMYKHLNFHEQTFFENRIQLLKSAANEIQSRLRKPYEQDKLPLLPNTNEARYVQTKNRLDLPPGTFQPPVFRKQYPKSHNYGALGTVIGRELTHTCDQDGRNYDHKGNEKLWWTQRTSDQYRAKAKCIVNKYDAYSEEIEGKDMYMDGPRTLSENIASHAGVKAAYEAYLDYERANGPEQPLPGVDLTHRQMFFIKFAQNWCLNMTPESTIEALETSRLPLNKYRVIGALSDYDEFSKAFGCSAGTTMNPAYKCPKIW